MRVCVSVKGRFHAFELCRELQRHDAFARLITSYPSRFGRRFGVDESKVASVPWMELLGRLISRCPPALQDRFRMQARSHAWFDRAALPKIDPTADLFVGWSGVSLRSIREARRLGMVTIVERGSCHIEEQRDLLAEEAQRLGVHVELPHPEVVEQELREYAEADFVAVPGTFARNSFIARGVDPERILTAPLGVDLTKFSPVLDAAESAPSRNRFRVLYCGAVSAQKGVHYLLEAFARLADLDAELWVVGPLLPELRDIVKRHHTSNVRFLGRVAGEELPAIYRQCSAFCLPSIQDGMGLVLLQAMASGLPVIATPHTGAPDLIEDGREGFLVPIRDPSAIERALRDLIDDPPRREAMSRAAVERASQGFGWIDYGERVVANYRRALAIAGDRRRPFVAPDSSSALTEKLPRVGSPS